MRRVLVPVTLVLVLAGLLTTSALLWLDDRESVDRGALVAARQGAVSFFSLDYRHAGGTTAASGAGIWRDPDGPIYTSGTGTDPVTSTPPTP